MEDSDAPEDEGQHLQNITQTDEDHGGPGKFALSDGYHWTEATSDPDPKDCGERLLHAWGNWWLRSSRGDRRWTAGAPCTMRPLLLEKTPSNLVHTRWLRAAFGASARFLIVVRHPIAVALATREFLKAFDENGDPPPLRTCLRNWVTAHDRLAADAVELRKAALLDDARHGSGDSVLLRVRFSDLVRDPRAALDRIAAELVDAPLHISDAAIAAVVDNAEDPDEKYRAMWRAWPDRAFDLLGGGREAGADGIAREFAAPFARHGFPRAFRDDWARS